MPFKFLSIYFFRRRKIIHFGCVICNKVFVESSLVACSQCSLEFHLSCLGAAAPSVVEGWHCADCRPPLKLGKHSCSSADDMGEYEQAAASLLSLLSDSHLPVVTNKEARPPAAKKARTMSIDSSAGVKHRVSCHRCGNLRKNNTSCDVCPMIFCRRFFFLKLYSVLCWNVFTLQPRCSDKMRDEHGLHIFETGCPVCKKKCCCGGARTSSCSRVHHCYKKCPATKALASSTPITTFVESYFQRPCIAYPSSFAVRKLFIS